MNQMQHKNNFTQEELKTMNYVKEFNTFWRKQAKSEICWLSFHYFCDRCKYNCRQCLKVDSNLNLEKEIFCKNCKGK